MKRPLLTLAGIVSLSALTVVAAGCQSVKEGSEALDGPLLMTRGHMTNMLVDMGKGAFFAIPACLDTDQPGEVRLLSIRAVEVSGAEESDIEFLAAWPAQNEPIRIGAGPMRMLEEPFGPYEATSGIVETCRSERAVTGLEVAVVIPDSTDTAVVVERLRVEYTLAGQEFVENVGVTLGMCSASARNVDAEPEECKNSE